MLQQTKWIKLSIIFWFILSIIPVYAIDRPQEQLKNTQLELRAEHIGLQLRCLICQNETIEDSSASLAVDLRKKIREQIIAGNNDQQIIQWMVDRYGIFIRYEPPLNYYTILLWFSPILSLTIGLCLTILYLRKNKPASPPLSSSKKNYISKILDES